ncbi:ArfGap-domain-containing protein [Glonium stellatum]|uniref:ArfGap-domain-containing protein n=1 Tax=Glonium stellatum TaxID=574774 RepID=A0A8E2F7F9_9PEZI|nr:ArfGap-domain-containing protein [Glonium stellatum]
MASALNKRQQARNERALQELIKTVPGNDRCADCGARNPGWASWSLGVFLCMRCATLHRKLGTHISKVKSLSMDSWNNEQVDNMKRVGNTESNRHFNPRNIKPQIPMDIDEVDGALERFIRQKYEHKAFSSESRPGTRQNTGSTSSVEDRPPPLPPKPGKRFGFGLRAASSTFPMSKTVTPPISPGLGVFPEDPSPPRVNKASRVFGSNVGGPGDGFESKLTTLRDMGFPDEKRNSTVLKGLNGNLDKAVEALIRLGEGGSTTARGNTPVPPAKSNVNGITIDRTRTAASAASSNNPFDQLDAVPQPPQQQQQQNQMSASLQIHPIGTNGPSYSHPASPLNPYNPFLSSSQQLPFAQQPVDQTFQNLQLSQNQQQQPLFPNRTGGYDSQSQQLQQTNPFQHSFTPPPVPQIPQIYNTFLSQQPSYPPQQTFHTPQAPQAPVSSSNPFLRSTRSQIFTQTNPFDQHQYQGMSTTGTQSYQAPQNLQTISSAQTQAPNPFQQQSQMPQQFQQQQQQQQPQQQQNDPFQQQQQQPQAPQQAFNPNVNSQLQASNPYQQQSQFQSQPQQQFQPQQQPQFQQQPQQQPAQQSFNKSSILALYNYPHLAPVRPSALPSAPSSTTAPPTASMNKRSVTMPLPSAATAVSPATGTMNPFASVGQMQAQGQNQTQNGTMGGQSVGAGAVPPGNGTRHVSNESVDFAGMMGGRHSPDAFSGLSARFVR